MGINRLKTKAKDPTDCLFGVQLDGTPFNFPISAWTALVSVWTVWFWEISNA